MIENNIIYETQFYLKWIGTLKFKLSFMFFMGIFPALSAFITLLIAKKFDNWTIPEKLILPVLTQVATIALFFFTKLIGTLNFDLNRMELKVGYYHHFKFFCQTIPFNSLHYRIVKKRRRLFYGEKVEIIRVMLPDGQWINVVGSETEGVSYSFKKIRETIIFVTARNSVDL